MRKFSRLKKLSDKNFRLATGVTRKTFEEMLTILKVEQKKKKTGAPKALKTDECLLLSLEYLREYRTLFHISVDYGVSVATAWRTCRWVEDILVKDKAFSLPGKKALRGGDGAQFEVIIVDASESPIQRPKKKGS